MAKKPISKKVSKDKCTSLGLVLLEDAREVIIRNALFAIEILEESSFCDKCIKKISK